MFEDDDFLGSWVFDVWVMVVGMKVIMVILEIIVVSYDC